MTTSRTLLSTVLTLCLFGTANAKPAMPAFKDVSASHLPGGLNGRCMDVAAHDFDNDGDVDVMLAMEFAANQLLLNDGKGKFSRGDGLPHTRRDSEDIAVADFNQDGLADVVIVSEDDRTNEYYLNQGKGKFKNVSERIPLGGTSNAVVTADINGDGFSDVIIGNVGPFGLLMGDGKGHFKDETQARIGTNRQDVQDLALVDIDSDGDLDLLTGDEVRNRIFINDGKGFFTHETAKRLPDRKDITREVISADVDNDGDMDIYYANLGRTARQAQNRLLLNNGKGVFTEVSQSHLNDNPKQGNFTARFVDLNGDSAPDLIVPNAHINGTNNGQYQVFLNDGKGTFNITSLSPEWPPGNGFDIAVADFNGDGKQDLYLCNRARRNFNPENGGVDALLFAR